MKVVPIAISEAGEMVVSDTFWRHCKMLVSSVADSDLTNEEKHKKVSDCLLILVGDIGQTVLDIGIKVAVVWFKEQAAK